MKLNGVEFEIDFFEADQAEVFEEACFKLQQKTEEIDNNVSTLTASNVIRNYCQAVIDFLDEVFGEGASKEVFGERTNLKICLSVVKSIAEEKAKQDKEIEKIGKELDDLASQNTNQNRETRRKIKNKN